MIIMTTFELIKSRRSIRKYDERQIYKSDLEKIIEAGLYAPNAGGAERSMIVAVHNREVAEQLGKLNVANFDRSHLMGSYVSAEQPSIIDDPKIKSGFYGAHTVCVIFAQKNFLYNTADAFCCATTMTLAAHEMGIASCIVTRAEETFASDEGRTFLQKWQVPENMEAKCFVLLGYCKGDYPKEKARREGRSVVVEA